MVKENISKTPTVIITGASTGIGRELSVLYASAGYNMGLIARRGQLLEELKKDILEIFPERKIFCASADVSQTQEIREMIFKLTKQLGELNLFIANAGIGVPTPAWKKSWEGVQQILNTNILGAIAGIEAACEIMLNQRFGHLVGISSVATVRGFPASSAYCASKAALSTYLESIRFDLKAFGICVTSIHPGYIDTPMTEQNKHPMPFLLSAAVGANKIFRAIKKKKSRYYFPWQIYLVNFILKHMPNWLFDFLTFAKYRKGRVFTK